MLKRAVAYDFLMADFSRVKNGIEDVEVEDLEEEVENIAGARKAWWQ